MLHFKTQIINDKTKNFIFKVQISDAYVNENLEHKKFDYLDYDVEITINKVVDESSMTMIYNELTKVLKDTADKKYLD